MGPPVTRLDPDEALASLTPGSNVGQAFDHLRDRNLDLVARYADDLARPAQTSFPHAAAPPLRG